MEEVFWECFFNNAGVNGESSKLYTSIFIENKISQSILEYLNENYLKEMGITALGDVIRILKHCSDYKINGDMEIPKNKNTSKIMPVTSYKHEKGCEVPVPIKRIVTPEIEGGYIINHPKCQISLKRSNNRSILRKDSVTKEDSARTVILLEENDEDDEIDQGTRIFSRLGKTKISIPKETEEVKVNRKRTNGELVDNKTILKRFFHATLSRESQTQVPLSQKLNTNSKMNKVNVYSRLGYSNDLVLPYKGVFKLPNVKISDSEVESSNLNSANKIRKMEATSTTGDDLGTIIKTNLQFNNTSKKNFLVRRLGYQPK